MRFPLILVPLERTVLIRLSIRALQGVNGNATLPCSFGNPELHDGFGHAGQEEEGDEEEGAWPQETREQVQKILSFLLDDSAEGNDQIDEDNK